MDINFGSLSDRDIAERIYKAYGRKFFHYARTSWQLDEDDVWDVLYDTLYGFINSYANKKFSSEKQVGALVWTIFRNRLRDKLRQNKKKKECCKEVDYSENLLINNNSPEEQALSQISDDLMTQENKTNPILQKLDSILVNLKDWERQLLLCRANGIPYKVVEEMTGKKTDFLKVHYQRLKKRISKKLKQNFNIERLEK